MRRTAIFVGLACIGLIAPLASACGGSGGVVCIASCVPGCPCPEAGGHADSPTAPPDAGKDVHVTPAEVGIPEASPMEASDAAGCAGLDATVSALGLSPACVSCVGANCCAQFQKCEVSSACISIEVCTGTCIEKGGAVSSCATGCIGDSGSDSGVSDADALDGCIVGSCSTPCGAP